jgi:predicted phage baseplate assembly protein
MFQVFARDMQTTIQRLNRAPGKNFLAFLDMMGISLIPPQAATAPVVFKPVPRAANGQVPAGAQLGAKVPGQSNPLTFETQNAIAMAAANLVQVAAVWPERDQYADYSSAVTGGRPFTLFDQLQPIPHVFYLANDTLFAFSGTTIIQIEFDLSTPGSEPLSVAWEFWDGRGWRPFAPFDPELDPSPSIDGTGGFTRSGVITLQAQCGKSAQTSVQGIKAYWIRGRLDQPLPPSTTRVLAQVHRIRIRTVLNHLLNGTQGLQFDAAFAGSQQVDLTKTAFPFDRVPQTGNVFYFSSQEAFSKPFASVTVNVSAAKIVQQPDTADWSSALIPAVAWEYWNGSQWSALFSGAGDPSCFTASGTVAFTVPPDMVPTKINGQMKLWVRARLSQLSPGTLPASGANYYGGVRTVYYQGPDPASKATPPAALTYAFKVTEYVPPAIDNFCFGYTYKSPWTLPDQCFTYNDFQWSNHTQDVQWPGTLFPVFTPVADTTPSLYLGFDQPLPNDYVSLYLDIQQTTPPTIPLVWEGWDGEGWEVLEPDDETNGLTLPGIAAFIAPAVADCPTAMVQQASANLIVTASPAQASQFIPGNLVVIAQGRTSELAVVQSVQLATLTLSAPLLSNYTSGTVTLAALPRFGTPLDWIRTRLKDDGAPPSSNVNGIYLNAVRVVQLRTNTNENLGAGNGQAGQMFTFNQNPVLPGERIEVQELTGALAQVQYPILKAELLSQGFTDDDIRAVTDPRSGNVTEVWVRWQGKPNLYFSGPNDRHYVMERASGQVTFGDGVNGMLIPATALAAATLYQSGGGAIGNVPPGAINQLLSGVLAQAVNNPRAGEGGSDGETVPEVMLRGPNTFRHLERSLAAIDYESLAYEASPAVAAVRCLPTTGSDGLPLLGWVEVIIVPHSQEDQPQPTFGLCQEVQQYLAARAPATVSSGRITVTGPTYFPIGVYARIVPLRDDAAGAVESAAVTALQNFLNPVNGGPIGQGWPFGRGIFHSDLATILQKLPDVDYVDQMELIVNNSPAGDQVAVPPDKLIAAGPIQIVMQSSRN